MSEVHPTKRCTKCGQTKPITDFGVVSRRPDGRNCQCKPCVKEYTRVYRKGPVRRAWVKKARRKMDFSYRYGLTVDQYDDLLAKQGHTCAICRTTKPLGRWGRFVVDHDHDTGKVRGLLCNSCNVALGRLGDTVEGLSRAMMYIKNVSK
jgi:hypothetical protein